jgi:hypothetical protein
VSNVIFFVQTTIQNASRKKMSHPGGIQYHFLAITNQNTLGLRSSRQVRSRVDWQIQDFHFKRAVRLDFSVLFFTIFTFSMNRFLTNTSKALTALLFSATFASAQINPNDPLSNTRHLISEDEILLLWNETSADGSIKKKFSSFYDFNPSGQNLTAFANVENANPTAGITGFGSADAAAGLFFNQNTYSWEGLVQAWRGSSGNTPKVVIEISTPANIYTAGSTSLTEASLFGQKNMAAANSSFVPQVSVAAGNFWGDREEEFFVVYHAADNNIAIELYEPVLSCNSCFPDLSLTSSLVGPAFPTAQTKIRSAILDVDAGDVDADGQDELVVAYTNASDALVVSVYDVNAQGQIVLKTQQTIASPNWTFSRIIMGVTVGDFNSAFAGEEIAVAARWGTTGGTGGINGGDTRMYVARLSGTNLLFDSANNANFFETTQFNQSDGVYGLSIASGDLNGDLTEEVVLVVGPTVFMFKINETTGSPALAIPSQLGSFSHSMPFYIQEGNYSNEFLAVGNVDNLNGNFGYDFRSEIVIGKNQVFPDASTNNKQQSFFLRVFGFNNTPGNPTQVNYNNPIVRNKIDNQFNINNDNDIRRYAVAMGDFNGGSVQLGNPTVTTLSDVLTPLVVINAPPTHFDVFGNNAFDINNLYAVGEDPPGVGADHFKAIYKEITSMQNSFETKFTSDWALSTSVNAGFAAAGFNIGAKMTQTYGEQFSKFDGGSSTVTIVEQRSARLDDELLAYTVDYTLYEYPVYNTGDGTPITNLLVVVPGNLQKTFTAARSKTHRYQLSHQHGNIFSYPATVADLELENAGAVYDDLSEQEISKTSGAESLFGITWTQATASGVTQSNTTKTEVGVEAGGSFKGFGLGASVNGSYATTDVNTKTSNYQQSVELAGFFGQGETSSFAGDYSYFIKPIIYWSQDGSLVLDYLVDVDNIEFWSVHYNKYDPAFLLPYQYEQEKGFPPLFESERYKTRDILVAPFPSPNAPVTLKARVHNYGFFDTPAATPLEVCFYYSDPAAGGAPVQIGCTSINQSIRGRITDFDSEIVELDWTVPMNLGPNTHVFAIIDGNNALPAEVHDYPVSSGVSNNFGWTCLFNPNCTPPSMNALFPTTAINEVTLDNSWSVYPNPVAESLILENADGQTAEGRIWLFDMSGRLVKEWNLPANSPLNRLQVHDQVPGVYLLKVATERGVFVEKIVKR